ncbi:MAG TPA: hypothetical protein VGU63_00860 [Candidatus Acidoferrales bacterium]|nr:hypothetical protein [Candidatus Acidoferrales bacterium]
MNWLPRSSAIGISLFFAMALNLPAQTSQQTLPTLKRRPEGHTEAKNIPGASVPEGDAPGADDALAFLQDSPPILPPLLQLTVDAGVPLRVMLKKSVPVKRIGEPIQAFTTEPIYSFDRVVIPKNTEVDGHITDLTSPSKMKRTAAYLNADFSPHRALQVEFDALILNDGTRIPLRTRVVADAGPVIRLETNPQKNGAVHRARGLISQQWHLTMEQIKPSAVWQHAKQFAWNEWPYHKQKIAAGTVFDAELEQPLEFGSVAIAAEEMGAMGQLPAVNNEAYARLATPLSSATAHLGTPVSAILTRPIFSPQKKLLLPVGTELQGMVVHAEPARRMHRNGQLHFTLQRVQLPLSTPQPVEMALEGIEVPKSSHIKLDSEGDTSVASDKESRVLRTALSVAIATSTMHHGDSDDGPANQGSGAGKAGVAGGSGYKLIGFALGIGLQSRAFGQVMGFVGAGESFYFHFITRGNDLVLPKDTPIEVSFGQHHRPTGP